MERVVAAPSKLRKPSGDQVKTNARDALHFAHLLRLDEVVEVTVPSIEQEATRDLARANARGDLIHAAACRNFFCGRKLSIYPGGAAWTGVRDVWLHSQRFDQKALQATFDSNFGGIAAD